MKTKNVLLTIALVTYCILTLAWFRQFGMGVAPPPPRPTVAMRTIQHCPPPPVDRHDSELGYMFTIAHQVN